MNLSSSFPLFLIFLLSNTKLALSACHVDDESGLLAFKSAITADPSGILASWKPGTDCCSWFGITCDEAKRVSMLYLPGQPENSTSYLSGRISPSLSKLQKLVGVYLLDLRKLTGPFPEFLFRLPALHSVPLRFGRLPTCLKIRGNCQKLKPKSTAKELDQNWIFLMEMGRETMKEDPPENGED